MSSAAVVIGALRVNTLHSVRLYTQIALISVFPYEIIVILAFMIARNRSKGYIHFPMK